MAVDYFLKIDGIPGESTDGKHKDEIDLLGWGWSESQTGTHSGGGGGGAGKVNMADFSFDMAVNKASPKLFLACATGKHIKDALLTCRKAGGKQIEYLKIKFTDLLISSYTTGGSQGSDVAVENIRFNFSTIKVSYFPQKPDGSAGPEVGAGYDCKKNEPI